jgi:hypothetical protein
MDGYPKLSKYKVVRWLRFIPQSEWGYIPIQDEIPEFLKYENVTTLELRRLIGKNVNKIDFKNFKKSLSRLILFLEDDIRQTEYYDPSDYIQNIETFSYLQELKMDNVNLRLVPSFESFVNLEKLWLSNFGIYQSTLDSIGTIQSLKFLSLIKPNFYRKGDPEISLEFIRQLKNLRELTLSEIPEEKELDLKFLAPLKSLSKLFISNCSIISLVPLESIPLKSLTLSGVKIGDKNLESILKITSLEDVDVNYIMADGMDDYELHLRTKDYSRLPNLKRIDMSLPDKERLLKPYEESGYDYDSDDIPIVHKKSLSSSMSVDSDGIPIIRSSSSSSESS